MNRERGFTLVEALIAFAILAVSLVALYEAMGTSLSGLARSNRFEDAALVAESRLAELAAAKRLPRILNGVADAGYAWRIELVASDTPESPEIAASPLRAQPIRLFVTWAENGRRRDIAIERLLLVQREPGG